MSSSDNTTSLPLFFARSEVFIISSNIFLRDNLPQLLKRLRRLPAHNNPGYLLQKPVRQPVKNPLLFSQYHDIYLPPPGISP